MLHYLMVSNTIACLKKVSDRAQKPGYLRENYLT